MAFEEIRAAQALAAKAMHTVAASLQPGMSEAAIARLAENCMRENGAEGWWYHNVGALVLAGSERSLLSISGRDYRPSEEVTLGKTDLVTLDFSPILGGVWGDYARTIYMENGKAILEPDAPSSPEFAQGYAMELRLHQALVDFARPETTYEDVWRQMNELLSREGWVNRDFHGNLGHSIESAPADRIYLEKGNRATLGGYGKPFTFEPHISRQGGCWGFKREQIYAFGPDGRLAPL